MENPIYLGDGVYARYENYYVILTTVSHDEADATNIIYLEAEVLDNLNRWLKRLFESNQLGNQEIKIQ